MHTKATTTVSFVLSFRPPGSKFLEEETLAEMFFQKFCEILKTSFL